MWRCASKTMRGYVPSAHGQCGGQIGGGAGEGAADVGEVARGVDVVGQELRVPADGFEAARAPGVLPGQAEEVQARATGRATPVHGVAAAVEGGDLDPAVVAAEAGRPDHRGDARGDRVEFGRLLGRFPHRYVPGLL